MTNALRQVGLVLRWRHRLDGGVHMQPLRGVASDQRRAPGQRLVDDCRQRIDVAALIEIDAVALQLFRRQIRPVFQARQFGRRRFLRVGEKAHQPDAVVGIDQQMPRQ